MSTPRATTSRSAASATIRYGLGAVEGVGRGAVEALIAEREARGPFTSLEDLCRRIDLQKVNRRVLEALMRSGSLDGLGANRATLMAALPRGDAARRSELAQAHEAGQNDLFGWRPMRRSAVRARARAVELPEWSEARAPGRASARRWACT